MYSRLINNATMRYGGSEIHKEESKDQHERKPFKLSRVAQGSVAEGE